MPNRQVPFKHPGRCRRGITLIEVVVVITISAILLAIMFALSGPMREKATETACISNLKQLYQANILYAEASDSGSAFPELHGMSYVHGLEAQKLAFPDRSILLCPGVPEVYRRKDAISYASALWFDPKNESGDISSSRSHVIEREKEQGAAMTIVECTAHDEFYYAPQEKDVDNYVASPFRVYLHVDGSVVAHRFQTFRDFPITGATK